MKYVTDATHVVILVLGVALWAAVMATFFLDGRKKPGA